MIPKTIHYCWFGGNPLPDLAIKCISSWKEYFPDYEIKEWNESNFDLNCCAYVKEAYDAKKWAFVSDYARFWILYNYGGLYFDTDVEVIKDMSDIIKRGAFMGCESFDGSGILVNPGLGLGVGPGVNFYKEILDDYNNSHFLNSDGTHNYMTVVTRTTDFLVKHGLQPNDELQKIDGINIYPKDYFCPMDYTTGKVELTENSCSIHWYDASWLDSRMKKRKMITKKIRNLFKGKLGVQLSKVYMTSSYYWEWATTGQWNVIKSKIKEKF